MKTVIIVRHAKSSWATIGQSDIERPLNERGKKDAPEMAGKVKEKFGSFDFFVSSPARRAFKTCKLFCEVFDFKKEKIMLSDQLYQASAKDFYAVISALPNKAQSAILFSHNPGVTDFVNTLSADFNIDNMPTCGVVGVRAETDNWNGFGNSRRKIVFFEYPKKNAED